MLPYRVGNFWAVRWTNDPVQYSGEVVATHNVPGMHGLGHQMLGVQGDEFSAVVTAYFESMDVAQWNALLVQPMRQDGPVAVRYNGIEQVSLGHVYKVLRAETLLCRWMPRAVGRYHDYQPAVQLDLGITLVPHLLNDWL